MKVNEEKLEETLVANWTDFIDPRELRDFVLNEIQMNLNSLTIIPNKKNKINANSISVSRFYFSKRNYFIWVEFLTIVNGKIAEGTMEIIFSQNEEAKLSSIFGNLYYV